LLVSQPAEAQNRGVYPLGMTASNSGVTPDGGITYINQLLFYSRDSSKDARGETIATGNQAVLMDMSTVSWVNTKPVIFGARYSASATIPVARNQLTGDVQGVIGGGAGLADSFYIPIILAWDHERLPVRLLYGVLAPTGHFVANGSENVGSGYWTSTIASGQTFFPTASKRLAVSAFQMYELHTEQEGTHVKPGDTFDLDYSVLQAILPSDRSWQMQFGAVGYEQRQMSARTGPSITSEQTAERYLVNAIGAGLNVVIPKWRFSAGARFFDEFTCRSTYQGFSLQFSGAIGF
jgi:hypothetical protein